MKNNEENKHEFLFEKVNYKILLIGIGVIVLGFILMSGGGSDDPNVFNEEIFNFRRIRLAPTTVLIGFGITIYAILKNSKKA
nr:DUF3098 domain-containing protein [uncultured Flavobacterium sp.]